MDRPLNYSEQRKLTTPPNITDPPDPRDPRAGAQEVLRRHGGAADAGAPAPRQQQRAPAGGDLRGLPRDGAAHAARARTLRLLRPRPALQGKVDRLVTTEPPYFLQTRRISRSRILTTFKVKKTPASHDKLRHES